MIFKLRNHQQHDYFDSVNYKKKIINICNNTDSNDWLIDFIINKEEREREKIMQQLN